MRQASKYRQAFRELLADADCQVRIRLAAALLVVCVGALLTALAPLALQRMIDALVGPSVTAEPTGLALTPAWVFASIYVAVLCSGRLLGEIRPLLMGTAEQRMQTRLSHRFLAHALALPVAVHLESPHGSLLQTLGQAAIAARLVVSSLLQCLPTAIELMTVIVVLGQLGHPALVAIFVVSAVAYALVFRHGMRRISHQGKEVSQRSIEVSAGLADALVNVETIKCFTASEAVQRRFQAATGRLELGWSRLHRQRAKLGLGVAAVFSVSVAAAVLVTVDAVQQGALSVGGLVLATVYMLQMVRPIETLGAAARDIGQAFEFARPALEFLSQPVESHAGQRSDVPPAAFPGPAPIDIRMQDVRLAYRGGVPVLNGASLHIPAGSSLAIVGPSGSGKSSLARLVLRLVEADAGCISFGGVPSGTLDPADIRARIGFVPQDIVLFDDTITMNVGIGHPTASQSEIEAACRTARVHDFVNSLPAGYETRVGPRGLKLSGGERQRIGIARAILKRPSIYLFDEATSALDVATETEVVQDLRRACAGCTTIFITHRVAAARCADRVAVLRDGQIVELGTHAELLRRNGAYARSFQAQHETPFNVGNAASTGLGA